MSYHRPLGLHKSECFGRGLLAKDAIHTRTIERPDLAVKALGLGRYSGIAEQHEFRASYGRKPAPDSCTTSKALFSAVGGNGA